MARMKQIISMAHMSVEEHNEALHAITEAIKLSRADDDMRGTVKYIFLAMDVWVSFLSSLDPEDTSKIRLYRQGCEKAMRLAKESVKLSIRVEDKDAESMAHYWVGTMHVMMHRPAEAKASADTALEISETANDRLTEMYAKQLQVQIFLQEQKMGDAQSLLKEVQEIAKELGDPQAKTMADQLKDLVMGSGGGEAAVPVQVAAPTQASTAASSDPSAPAEEAAFVAPDEGLMKSHIIAMVKNMTGGDEEVDGDTPLMESGVDSLASVELRTQLQQEFKVSLPSTVMFNYPTIGGITGLLVEEYTTKKLTWTG